MAKPNIELYLQELYRWNERINLTSILRTEADIEIIEPARHLLANAELQIGIQCADLGSGGGCPGLVMALLRPDLQVTLIESDQRKAAFLQHTAAICECENVTIVAKRAQEMGHDPQYRQSYDVVVSRAAAKLPALCELALPLVRVGGRLVAIAVTDDAHILRDAAPVSRQCGGGDPRIIADDLIEVSKMTQTDSRYPRRKI